MKTYKKFIIEVRSITKFELDKLFQKTLIDIQYEENEERIKKRMNSFAKEIEKNPDLSIIGHINSKKEMNLVTKTGKNIAIKSMGWKSF